MVYNTTNVTEANDFYEIVYYLNELSGGYIGLFIIVVLSIVIFMSFKKYEKDTKEVLLVDSVLTLIVCVLFWGINLIDWKVTIYPVIGLVASLIIYKFSN